MLIPNTVLASGAVQSSTGSAAALPAAATFFFLPEPFFLALPTAVAVSTGPLPSRFLPLPK